MQGPTVIYQVGGKAVGRALLVSCLGALLIVSALYPGVECRPNRHLPPAILSCLAAVLGAVYIMIGGRIVALAVRRMPVAELDSNSLILHGLRSRREIRWSDVVAVVVHRSSRTSADGYFAGLQLASRQPKGVRNTFITPQDWAVSEDEWWRELSDRRPDLFNANLREEIRKARFPNYRPANSALAAPPSVVRSADGSSHIVVDPRGWTG